MATDEKMALAHAIQSFMLLIDMTKVKALFKANQKQVVELVAIKLTLT